MAPPPQPLPNARTLSSALWVRAGRIGLSFWLAGLVVICFVRTLHWPLVNDGALQHYISFLTDSGLAPYRQIGDMNLPGSLMIDWAVVHTLGGGPVAWRLFDALLMLGASAALLAIARPYDSFAGVFAAALLFLLHARDGMGQTGQRDLMEAALLLAMVAFAFRAARSQQRWPLVCLGLCAGAAATIKPDSLLFFALVLGTLALRSPPGRRLASLALPFMGFCIPLAAALGFLVHYRAVSAFWTSLTQITPYYARLDRQSSRELLRDCLSTPMRALLAGAVLLAILNRRRWTWERFVLAAGVAWGLVSFFLQGKGYLYHRYPTLAFLLAWAGIEATEALRGSRVAATAGAAALLYGCLLVAPLSLLRASRATWNDDLLNALEADLTELGGSSLAREVQCIDSISGCNTVLYRMRLAEETGMLSDFLIFGPATEPAVRRTRGTFWSALSARPPRVIVVTSWLHPAGPDDFRKLDLWPEFGAFLNTRYTVFRQRQFRPGMSGPLAYRIYLLR